MRRALICLLMYVGGINISYSQNADTLKNKKENTAHIYFIISAGDKINAFYNDKPLSVETISEFNEYIQRNAKTMKDSWVVVTGTPKSGTYDEVLKTLKRFRFKNITKNTPGK